MTLTVCESCRHHRRRAWNDFQKAESAGQKLVRANDLPFQVLFQTVVRRQPNREQENNILVRAAIDCLVRSPLSLSRFSGATAFRIVSRNQIYVRFRQSGALEINVPKNIRNMTPWFARKLMTRRIADAIVAFAGLPIQDYKRSRQRVQLAQSVLQRPHCYLIEPGSATTELRKLITAVFVGRLSVAEVCNHLESTRESYLLGVFASLFLEPAGAKTRLVG